MKNTTVKFSWGGKAVALVLAIALLVSTMGSFSVFADSNADVTKQITVSEGDVSGWLRAAGENGLELDAGILQELAGANVTRLGDALQERISQSGILIHQKRLGNNCALFVAAPSADATAENLTLIGVNGNKEDSCEFVMKITGEHFYVYQATLTPYHFETVSVAPPAVNGGLEPEELPSSSENEAVSSSELSTSSEQGASSEEAAAGDTSDSLPPSSEPVSSEDAVSSGESVSSESIGEGESMPSDGTAVSSEPTESTKQEPAESGEAAPEPVLESKPASEPSSGMDGAASSTGGTAATTGAWNGVGVSLAVNTLLAAVQNMPEEIPEPLKEELTITEGASAELFAEDLEALRGSGYRARLEGAGFVVLQASINPNGSPFTLADSILGKDAGEKASASVSVEVEKETVPTGEPFTYTVRYNLKSSPVFKYSDSFQEPLFEGYENTKVLLQLPEGVVADESDSLKLENGVYVYDLGTVSSAYSGSFQITARMEGNGEIANGTSYPKADLRPIAKITADVTAHDYTDGNDNTRLYPMDFSAADYPSVKNSAEDVWVLRKTLVKAADGREFAIEGEGKDAKIVLTYKIEVGLDNGRGEPTGDSGERYDRFGRLNFTSYQMTDRLPTFERNGKTYLPVSSEIRFAGEADALATGGPGAATLTVDQYKTADHNKIKGAPYYSAYEVKVKYNRADLNMEFDDPLADSGIDLTNHATLEYTLVGDVAGNSTDAVKVNIRDKNAAATLRIWKYIGKDEATAQPYGSNLEKDFPGYAKFKITDGNGFEKTVYVNPTKESGEDALNITGDDGYIDVSVAPGTYTVTEITAPSFTDKSNSPQTLTVAIGETGEAKFYNPVKGKGYLFFTKLGKTDGNPAKALEGAEFGLYKAGTAGNPGELVATATSDEKGSVRFTAEIGSYIVKETKAPKGYLLDTTLYPVEITDGGVASLPKSVVDNTLTNMLNEGSLLIQKQVYEYTGSGKKEIPVPEADRAGFEFRLESNTDGGWKTVSGCGELKLDGKSQIQVNKLPVFQINADGSKGPRIQYRIVETKKPDRYGYDAGKTAETVVPDLEQCAVITVKILNLCNSGSLKLEKHNFSRDAATGNIVDSTPVNVAFKLYRKTADGKLEPVNETVYKTGENGIITVKGLPIADAKDKAIQYYWQETETPAGFQLAGTVKEELKGGGTIEVLAAGEAALTAPKTLTANNISTKALLKVEKRNTGKALLAGAVFKLEKLVGENYVTVPVDGKETWTSEAAAKTIAVEPGTYRITEVTPPEGYLPYKNPASTGGDKGEKWRTVTVKDWTTVEEYKNTAVSTETFVNDKPQVLQLHKHVYLYQNYGKVNDQNTNNGYESATFDVYRMEGDTLKKAVDLDYYVQGQKPVTGAESIVIKPGKHTFITNLEAGTYYLKETSVTRAGLLTLIPDDIPEAYLAGPNLSGDNWLVKKDVGGQSGVFFGGITMADGRENKKNVFFEVRDFQNYTAMKLEKRDADTEALLPGATFRIHGETPDGIPVNLTGAIASYPTMNAGKGSGEIGTVVKDGATDILATTGKAGNVIIDKLPIWAIGQDGKQQKVQYTVTETAAPEGYALDSAPKKISALLPMAHLTAKGNAFAQTSKDGVLVYPWGEGESARNTLVLQNEPFGSVTVRKVGRDLWSQNVNAGTAFADTRLSGVELALYREVNGEAELVKDSAVPADADGVVRTTDEFGEATFTKLDNKGTYYIIEVATPAGYSMPAGKKGLRLTEDGKLPGSLSAEELKSCNVITWDGSKTPADQLKGNPLVNEKSWAQFKIVKKDADETAKFLDGARFQVKRVPATDVATLDDLTALDLSAAGTVVGKDFYESGATLQGTGGNDGRDPGVVHTDKFAFGDIYWITEITPPGGYQNNGAPTTVLLPESLYVQLMTGTDQTALNNWKIKNGVHEIVSYRPNEETLLVFLNKKDADSSGGDGDETAVYVKLKKVVYPSKAEMEADTEGTAGAPLGGVTFGLWLLDTAGNPIVKLDTLTTGLDFADSKISNQAVSNRIDLAKYKDIPNTSVVNRAGAYTAKLRLIEESAPAGVVLEDRSYDLEVTGGKDHETYYVNPIRNYTVDGYVVTLQKFGYTRRDGLNYANSGEKGLNEDQWLDTMVPAGSRTPLAGVEFQLEKRVVQNGKETWTEVSGVPTVTNAQGQIVYLQTAGGKQAGLEPGRYRLRETLGGSLSSRYENTHARNSEYEFTVTNGNKTITLFNPEKPQVRIVKNPRGVFSQDGSAGMKGAKFELSGNGGKETLVIGENGVSDPIYLDRGNYTVKELASPEDSFEYTKQYAYLTDAAGERLEDDKIVLGWKDGKWIPDNTLTVYAQDARAVSLTIKKTDDTGTALAGAKFDVYRILFNGSDFENGALKAQEKLERPAADSTAWGKPFEEGLVTDGNGEIQLKGIAPGWYKIVETQTLENHTLDATPQIVFLPGDLARKPAAGATTEEVAAIVSETVTFINAAYDTLTVEKTFTRGAAGEGVAYPDSVTFEVYEKSGSVYTPVAGNENRITVSIDAQSGKGANHTRLPKLAEGKSYVLKESSIAPASSRDYWMLDTSANTVDANGYITASEYSGGEYRFTADNRYTGVKATLKKVGANTPEQGLSGAEFQVYYLSGTVKNYIREGNGNRIFTDGGNGEIAIQFLLPGALRTKEATQSGVTFYAEETKAPAGYVLSGSPVSFTVKPGEAVSYAGNANLIVKNSQGMRIQLAKFDNIYGAEAQKLGNVPFSLYKVAGENAVLVGALRTGADGSLTFDHLAPLGSGEQYALWENVPSGYVELESIHKIGANNQPEAGKLPTREMKTSDSGGATRTLVLLSDANTIGVAYSYAAYNLPKQTLIIEKSNYDTASGVVPTAKFSIYHYDESAPGNKGALAVANPVETKVSGKISTAQVALEPGKYVVEEIWSSLQLNTDDVRLPYRQTVTLEKGQTKQTVAFKNQGSIPAAAISKTVADPASKKLAKSLLEEGAEVTYTLSDLGGNGNQLPLDRYTVTDNGLDFYSTEDGKNSALDYDSYVKEQYTFTQLHIGPASYVNYLASHGGNAAEPKTVAALRVKITLTAFDGTTKLEEIRDLGVGGLTYEVPASYEGKPVNWKSFTVEYDDPQLEDAGNPAHNYALGQLFKAEPIQVTARIARQAPGTVENTGVLPVRSIKNTAGVEMICRIPNSDGVYSERTFTKKAEANITAPAPGNIPPVQVVKTSEIKSDSKLQIDGKLEYTLTLTNMAAEGSGLAMKNPVLVDLLPNGVEVISDAYGGTDQYSIVLPSGLKRDTTKRGSASKDDQNYLAVWFNGELKPQEQIVVKYQVVVQRTMLIYGQTLINSVQATSLEPGIIYDGNPAGASFAAAQGSTLNSGRDRTPAVSELFFNGQDYGYVGASVENTVSRQDSLQLMKRITADKEPGYENGTDYVALNKNALASSGGAIRYQLMVLNGGNRTYKNLRVLDMLPNQGDYTLEIGDYPRYTAWTPSYGAITKVERYDNGTKQMIPLSASDYTVYYNTNQFGKNRLPAAEAMMRADTISGDGWTQQKPEKAEDIKAIALDFDKKIQLATDERLVITMEMDVPEYADTADVYDKLAVNTFSVSSTAGTDTTRTRLSSNFVNALLEPENVGVGGHIWIDKNDDGIQNDEQLPTDGLPEGVTVELQVFHGTNGEADETRTLVTGADGKFRFDGLSPSAGDSRYTEEQLYDRDGNLLPDRLRGNKTSYRLVVIPPEGFALAKDYAPSGKQTRSTNPAKLMENDTDAKDVAEAKDSNFVAQGNRYVSERFYLWSGNLTDLTKDLGLIRVRDLEISKKDSLDQPIAGATFRVYGPYDGTPAAAVLAEDVRNNRNLAGEKTTAADGLISFEDLLFYKYYAVVETATNGQFTLDGATGEGALFTPLKLADTPAWVLRAATQTDIPAGKTAALTSTLQVRNNYAAGTLALEKLDGSTGQQLSGVRFKLTAANTVPGAWEAYMNDVEKAVSGAADVNVSDGGLLFTTLGREISIKGLPYGDYTLAEVSAPAGYERIEERTFTINRPEGYAFTGENAIRNERSAGRLSLEKVDATDATKKLAGAQFTLSLKDGTPAQKGFWEDFGQRYAAGNSGTAKWNNQALTVTVGADGLTVDGLPYAAYTLTETAPPTGYTAGIPAWSQSFTIGSENPVKSFTGEAAIPNTPYEYTLKKVDAVTGNVLDGAEFAVQSADGKTELYTVTTQGGIAAFTMTKLVADTEYLLVEKTAPLGYQKMDAIPFRIDAAGKLTATDKTPKEVVLSADGMMITVPNNLLTGQITVKKVVDGENLLPDTLFQFRLTKPDGKSEVFTLKAGEEQSFTDLALGSYTIEELPNEHFAFVKFDGLEEGASSQKLELTGENRTISVVAHNQMKATGSLTIEKQMLENSPAEADASFRFQLYRSTDGGAVWQELGAPVNLKPGETHTFTGLAPGVSYKAVELLDKSSEYRLAGIEPAQYADMAERSYRFLPTAAVPDGKATFINERKLGSVNLLKYRQGSPDITVDGASFDLYRYDSGAANNRGEKLASGTTAEGGKLHFANLTTGRYVLVETHAPNNYYVLKTQFEISLSVDEAGEGLTIALPANERVAVLEQDEIRIPNSYGPPSGGDSSNGGRNFGNNDFFENLVDILEDPTPLTNLLEDFPDLPVPLSNLPILPTTGGFPVGSLSIVGLALAAVGLLLKRKSNKKDTETAK